jgi:hypothetical protein
MGGKCPMCRDCRNDHCCSPISHLLAVNRPADSSCSTSASRGQRRGGPHLASGAGHGRRAALATTCSAWPSPTCCGRTGWTCRACASRRGYNTVRRLHRPPSRAGPAFHPHLSQRRLSRARNSHRHAERRHPVPSGYFLSLPLPELERPAEVFRAARRGAEDRPRRRDPRPGGVPVMPGFWCCLRSMSPAQRPRAQIMTGPRRPASSCPVPEPSPHAMGARVPGPS